MTPAQIELVQDSFRKVLPIKDTAGELFYNQLFTLDPELRPLFPEDLKPQIQKLMSMIATAVGGLTKLETIVPAVQELGRRHVGYGVKDKDYDTVGDRLAVDARERARRRVHAGNESRVDRVLRTARGDHEGRREQRRRGVDGGR